VSIHRYAAKTDSVQTELIRDLRAAGIGVWVIGRPVDLLLRFWCARHHDHCWQPLEIKTPYGKKDPKARVDPRQEKQQEFLIETMTPIATDFDSAWTELNKRHKLGRVEIRGELLDHVEPRLFRQPV